MDTQHEEHRKSTTLYDAGCGCVMAMLFGGAVLGVVGNQIGIISPIPYDAGGMT